MRRRKPRPPGITSLALQEYRERDRVLGALGFGSYDEYLTSPLWRDIRLRKLKEDGHCYGCGRPGCWQVHHADYSRETLLGESLIGLRTICDGCHRWAEFFGGCKLSPSQATGRLEKRREQRLGIPAVPGLRRLLDRDEKEKACYSETGLPGEA